MPGDPQDLDYDQRLQQIPRLLPSSLNLAAITAAEYCTNYVHQLRSVLASAPPNQPTQSAIDLLVSVAGLQRTLEERGVSAITCDADFWRTELLTNMF